MKGSHANRPTEVFENTKESMLKKLREWQIWAETQEKELRERMKQYAEEGSIGGDIIAQEYKEILG